MNKYKVLLVDDEPALLAALRRSLIPFPLEVQVAGSAAEGMKLMRASPADAVVSDQYMPEMTGAEFLEQVSKRWPDTLRIMLTGAPTLDLALDAVNYAGVFRLLTKPCRGEILGRALIEGCSQLDLIRTARALRDSTLQRQELLERLEQQAPGLTSMTRSADGELQLPGEHTSISKLAAEFDLLVRTALAAANHSASIEQKASA